MKKLNNKGITTIEVIVCFVLIVIITSSMYSTISSFNQKRLIEDYKSQVMIYKSILTKDIQDDFIKIGLTHVKYEKKVEDNGATTIYTLDCELRDGTSRRLYIKKKIAKSFHHLDGSENIDGDEYVIQYGPPGEELEYPLPNLGHSIETYDNGNSATIKDLGIDNVDIRIDDNNVLLLYIGLYHPELTTRYGIDIVCPVDYITAGADATNTLMDPEVVYDRS